MCIIMAFCSGKISGQTAYDAEKLDINPLLQQLDSALEARDAAIKRRNAEIDSMSAALPEALHGRTSGYLGIAESYRSLCADSSIAYLRKARINAHALGDSTLLLRSRIGLAIVLPMVEMGPQAIAVFDSVNPETVPVELKHEYFDAAADMYSSISDKSHLLPGLSEKYGLLADSYRQHAMRYYPPESEEWLFHEACRFYFNGNYSAAAISGSELLERLTPDDMLYGRAADIMARVSAKNGDREGELYYTLHNALSQIIRGDREGLALQRVGHLLYKKGDIDRAHSYLSAALSNTSLGMGADSDMTAESLMIIDKAYHKQWDRTYMLLWCMIAVITLMAIALIVTIMRYRRDMRRRNSDHERVERLKKDRVLYLTNFLKLCALSMRRTTEFSRMTQRKLASRQFEELFNTVKSGSMIDEQRRDMFQIFDRTFLKIYPDFVEKINSFLRPEEHYATPDDGRLVPELRIAALMCLGLTDTTRMADFLGYSPNTIYAYRAKIRSKARDNATFDRDFQSLSNEM